MSALQAAGVWTALCLLLMLALSLRVPPLRRKHQVGINDAGVPELGRAVRAFGNAAEYIPAALVALVLLALLRDDARLIHIIGATLFVGRLAHAQGISHTEKGSLGRAFGMLLTWQAYLLLAVALLFSAL